jgi:CRP-like cAMP-binding protein
MRRDTTPPDFGSLFEGLPKHLCDKGQILVSADDPPRGVFYIHEGYVKAYNISNEGDTQLIAILGPREIFPVHWAFDEDHESLFFETMSEVICSLLPKSEFKPVVLQDKHLLQVAVATLLASYRFSHLRIQNLQLRTAQERLAFRLLYLADNFGTKKGKTTEIDVPIVYQDLADAVALTRETTNRIMLQFSNEGLISRSDHSLTIEDYSKLAEILGE